MHPSQKVIPRKELYFFSLLTVIFKGILYWKNCSKQQTNQTYSSTHEETISQILTSDATAKNLASRANSFKLLGLSNFLKNTCHMMTTRHTNLIYLSLIYLQQKKKKYSCMQTGSVSVLYNCGTKYVLVINTFQVLITNYINLEPDVFQQLDNRSQSQT